MYKVQILNSDVYPSQRGSVFTGVTTHFGPWSSGASYVYIFPSSNAVYVNISNFPINATDGALIIYNKPAIIKVPIDISNAPWYVNVTAYGAGAYCYITPIGLINAKY